MKVSIWLPELKCFFYDEDYNTLIKFFQENLGESSSNVIDPDYVWDIHNNDVWLFLEIKLMKGIIKLFKGHRKNLADFKE